MGIPNSTNSVAPKSSIDGLSRNMESLNGGKYASMTIVDQVNEHAKELSKLGASKGGLAAIVQQFRGEGQ